MYLVIGFKPHEDDYCRGCHMGTYEEETRLTRLNTPQEVVEYIAHEEAFDQDGRRNAWEWTVVTGLMIDDENEYFGHDLTYGAMPDECSELIQKARQKEYEWADEWAAKKKREEKEVKAAQRKAEEDARDKSEYERLKRKFEGV